MLWQKGASANPRGKLVGTKNKRTLESQAIFEQHNFSPLEKKIKLALRIENKLRKNHFHSPEETLAYIAQYSDVLKDLLQYYMPKLRQVDHVERIEIIQKLQSLESYSDAEIDALIEEALEIAHGV